MRHALAVVFVPVLALIFAGCSTAPRTTESREALHSSADAALKTLYAADTNLKDFVGKAYGYAVFPEIGKGGLVVGGAYGRGVVYERGNPVGHSDVTQGSVGLQAGGQSFIQLICFENREAFERFTSGSFEFAGNASAVAIKAGASAAAKYADGVAVFTQPIGGLMFEASIGGQRFTYQTIAK